MGTIAEFLQVNNCVLETLIKHPDLADFYLGYEDWNELENNKLDNLLIRKQVETEEILNIDKTWYFFHYLFTGYETSEIPDKLIDINQKDKQPLINAILGGKKLPNSYDYDVIRYFTISEVNQIADTLFKLKIADVIKRLNTKKYHSEIYNYLSDYYSYDAIVDYYKDAASKSNAMLLWLN